MGSSPVALLSDSENKSLQTTVSWSRLFIESLQLIDSGQRGCWVSGFKMNLANALTVTRLGKYLLVLLTTVLKNSL